MAEIEALLSRLQEQLAPYERLVRERDRLLKARAAILGREPGDVRSRAAKRVSRADVQAVLMRRPGLRPIEIARALGVTQPTISAHLYRGKGDRFVSRGGRWYAAADPHAHSGR